MNRQHSLWAVFGAMLGLLLLCGGLKTASADATTLYNFTATSSSNGITPYSSLVQGSDGSFYGTTYNGGSSNKGTIFKLSPSGVLTTLVTFNGTNGAKLTTGLVQGSDGSFYGTTTSGGRSNKGTLFKLTTDGTAAGTTLTTLVSFNGTNGYLPYGPLALGSDGSIYGTTLYGGTTYGAGSAGNGTAFRLSPSGVLTLLYSFNHDGVYPFGGLIEGSDGSFYGTTFNGGATGYGTVFNLTTNGTTAGTTVTTLFSFNRNLNDADGAYPHAALVEGNDGSLYGTTSQGGTSNQGTLFQLTTDGTAAGTTLTTLVSFDGTNGAYPEAALLLGNDGSFYSVATDGGPSNRGTVFKLTTDGTAAETTLTTLVSFDGTNGAYPEAALLLGNDGSLYGTTSQGGTGSSGTVFKFTLPPAKLLSVAVSPTSLIGGSAEGQGIVTLAHPVYSPVLVKLTSSNPAVLSVRSSVTVTPTHRHALFTAVSHPVTTPTTVTITAVSGRLTKTCTVTVTP